VARMTPTDSALVAIVDDDDLFRRSIERLVRSAGFNVATFASAEDFLDSADLDRATCAILDMRLPGMNGLDLQQRLIARPTPMPIVFVSAHEEAAMRATALRAGAIAFLKKPFDNSALLDALNRSIR
jgi:two-component system, LuxR family, response regulator FixJ